MKWLTNVNAWLAEEPRVSLGSLFYVCDTCSDTRAVLMTERHDPWSVIITDACRRSFCNCGPEQHGKTCVTKPCPGTSVLTISKKEQPR